MNTETDKSTLNEFVDTRKIEQAAATLMKYKQGKEALENRIVEEERWWKIRHREIEKQKNGKDAPASAWLFGSITNKHADAMDNYPEPNVLPRERRDERNAETLSSVLPVVLERNEFEQTYSDAWWYKLKHGAVCYGVFWNNELERGLGDIDITYIDLLNVFWEPGITDIQDSRNLFIVSLTDTDLIEERFPNTKGKLGGNTIEVKDYVHDDNIDKSQKTVVIDWYYKKWLSDGRRVLHYCKFTGNTVLYATENDVRYKDSGWYEHGKYPVVFDILFPEEGTPAGFGLISVMKDPQKYIDKISGLMIENTAIRCRPRYFAKKSGGINEEEFLDLSKTLVHVEGSLSEENLRKIDVDDVPQSAFNILQMKIDELKETSSNRDVSQGSASSGVTSGAAIAALQEAGNKTSRDMVLASYRAYKKLTYLCIDLIEQFYTETRSFRITGDKGTTEYTEINSRMLAGENEGRRPVFDIVIKPQKRSAYSKLSQNELAKELYNLGFFNPENAEPSLAAVEMMDFDGKQKVKEQIQKGHTLYNQLLMMQEQVAKMSAVIMKLTGEDVSGGSGVMPTNTQGGGASYTAAPESYGERLAKNANVDAMGGGNI